MLPSWIEWSNVNLSDYEKGRAGPVGAYTSTQNAGMYYGCSTIGNAVVRGGSWSYTVNAGVFTLSASNPLSVSATDFGFRCAR